MQNKSLTDYDALQSTGEVVEGSSSSTRKLKVLLCVSMYTPKSEVEDLLRQTENTRAPRFTTPQGVLALAAYARKMNPGFEFKVIDFNRELFYFHKAKKVSTLENFIRKILKEQDFVPDVVGTSVIISTGHGVSLEIAKGVKNLWPDAITVHGGTHVTNFANFIIREDYIDYAIRGAADLSFNKFLENIADGKSPEGIPGVVVSVDNINTLALPVPNLDVLPMLAYDLIDTESYIMDGGRVQRKDDVRPLSYTFSRGCSFKCTFCTSNTVHGRKVIFKSNKLVIEEFKQLKKQYDINTIIIEDDLFGANKRNFYEFVEMWKKENLDIKFVFPNGFSVAVMNEEYIDNLVEIGLKEAQVAIESGAVYTQKYLIDKNVDLDKALECCHYLRKKGVTIGIYVIFGFPGESRELMEESLDFIRQLPNDWVDMLIASPLVGSVVLDRLKEGGILNDQKVEDILNNTDYRKRLYDTPEISARDLEKFVQDSNIEVNFFKNYNMRSKNYETAIYYFERILKNYKFHIIGLSCVLNCFHQLGDQRGIQKTLERMTAALKNEKLAREMYLEYEKDITDFLNKIDSSYLHKVLNDAQFFRTTQYKEAGETYFTKESLITSIGEDR